MYLLVSAATVIWLVLTISAQLSFSILTRLRRWDPFGFIPSWHFFAPNPARFDTVILMREFAASESDTNRGEIPWSIVAILYDERWYHPFFNPQRRIQKAVHDLQNSIGNMADHHSPEAICKSAPVQALFRYAWQKNFESSPSSGMHTKQFAIVRIEHARATPEARVVFVSEPMTTFE